MGTTSLQGVGRRDRSAAGRRNLAVENAPVHWPTWCRSTTIARHALPRPGSPGPSDPLQQVDGTHRCRRMLPATMMTRLRDLHISASRTRTSCSEFPRNETCPELAPNYRARRGTTGWIGRERRPLTGWIRSNGLRWRPIVSACRFRSGGGGTLLPPPTSDPIARSTVHSRRVERRLG